MKKIFLLLVLIFNFAFGTIDEYKTDVYFGNGILTKKWQAKKNATEVLKPAIIEKFGLNYFQTKIGKVDYAYNRTIGDIGDLFESGYQIINLQWLVDFGANAILNDKEIIHSLDLEDQVDAYEASIKNGHKVLVVAHSQGNLFDIGLPHHTAS